MIITHNYYIDYLKAFNAFLNRIFNNNYVSLAKANRIQKIEFNIGSKTVLTHKLYGNESFEYPNIIIDLQDVRIDDEGTKPIQRNLFGLVPSYCTAYPCRNFTKNTDIYVETRRYILNFNLQINVETNADLLNFYHIISNYLPLNYTFVDYSFLYFIDITDIALEDNWDLTNDDITGIFIMNNGVNTNDTPVIGDNNRVYTAVEVQPEIEITNLSQMVDKENMKYSIQMSVLMSASIPILIYANPAAIIKRIIIDIDFERNEYPILLDTGYEFLNKNIEKSVMISDIIINDDGSIDLELVSPINFDFEKNYFIRLIQNYIDPSSPVIGIPLDNDYFEDKILINENKITLLPDYEQTEILRDFLYLFKKDPLNLNMLIELKN